MAKTSQPRASRSKSGRKPVLRKEAPSKDSEKSKNSTKRLADAPAMDAVSVLGHVAWLMAQSSAHRFMFLTDLERAVLPAITSEQFKLYRKNKIPVAYASWAFLTEEAEQRYIERPNRLRPEDWTAGDRLWLIDVVAPFGGAAALASDIKQNVFPDRRGKALRLDRDGKTVRVVQLHGAGTAHGGPGDDSEESSMWEEAN